MTTIQHVLIDEYHRLHEAAQIFKEEIRNLPRGRPRIKRIHGKEYLYLNRREGPRVVDEYVGRADSEKARQIQEQVAKRDRISRLLDEAEAQLKELKKVLRGKI